jgi:hypothetical protein
VGVEPALFAAHDRERQAIKYHRAQVREALAAPAAGILGVTRGQARAHHAAAANRALRPCERYAARGERAPPAEAALCVGVPAAVDGVGRRARTAKIIA